MPSYLLAVLAACANATSSVLQRKANREIPRRQNLSWKLIRSVLHEPVALARSPLLAQEEEGPADGQEPGPGTGGRPAQEQPDGQRATRDTLVGRAAGPAGGGKDR
jgi:hypothetical protein